MFPNVEYPICFRLGVSVNLTEEEIRKVVNGDSEPIAEKIKNQGIHLGFDSYIPGSWVEDSPSLPESIKRLFKNKEGHFEDTTINLL